VLGTMVLRTGLGGPSTAVTLNDTLDSVARTITITQNAISGLGGTLNYSNARISSLTINAGSGGNTFGILGTRAATTLNTGAGDDGVIVGHMRTREDSAATVGDLTNLRGRLTVHGGSGTAGDTLNVVDISTL